MSVLPKGVVIALKERSRKSSVKEALRVAIYHYLRCEKTTLVITEIHIDS